MSVYIFLYNTLNANAQKISNSLGQILFRELKVRTNRRKIINQRDFLGIQPMQCCTILWPLSTPIHKQLIPLDSHIGII